MQKILGYIRKACQEFNLISRKSDNCRDKIAVGVSGGKDSLVLLAGLAGMRRFAEFDYDIEAVTLDPKFGGIAGDFSSISALCRKLGVNHTIVPTDIGEIVFDVRKEKNPCSLCANLRRGILNSTAKELGCNKLALGHHNDDVIETFIMNLFKEGRIGCFAPKSYLSRSDITVIRPLVFAPESMVSACCKRNGFEIVKSKCPADKNTLREDTKKWLADMEYNDKGFKQRIFGALRRNGVDGWAVNRLQITDDI